MNLFRKLFFSWWYWRKPPWDTNVTPPEVYQFVEQHPPGKALDLGCGTGTNAITLAQYGWQVTGIDFVSKPIHAARRKAQQAGVQVDFRVGDVTQLEQITGPFALILDIGCYHSLSPAGMQAYRENLHRLLKTEGVYLLYAFFKTGKAETGNGISEADLEAFSLDLELIDRVDGYERGTRPSAWLTFRKPES